MFADCLIRHVNEISNETGVVAVYSTPSCYLQALHASNLKWPTKSDDFFPYASENHTYWTGYFTSRPNLKRFERQGNNLLQVIFDLILTMTYKISNKVIIVIKLLIIDQYFNFRI